MAFSNPAADDIYQSGLGATASADSHPNISLPLPLHATSNSNGGEDTTGSGAGAGTASDPNASSNSINSLGASSKLPSLKDDFDQLNMKFEQSRVRAAPRVCFAYYELRIRGDRVETETDTVVLPVAPLPLAQDAFATELYAFLSRESEQAGYFIKVRDALKY